MVALFKENRFLNKKNISISVFFLCCAIGAFFCLKLNQAETEAKTAHTMQISNSYASSLEKTIRHSLSSVNSLAVLVHQSNGSIPNYGELARYMLPMYEGAYALSTAPDGVLQQIEPTLQNTLIKNHDIFEGKDKQKEIANIKEGDLKFVGPFKLIQGPQGAIGMLPVFLKKEDGTKYFWGYTVVTLQLPNAFSDVHLNRLAKNGYAYELSGINPLTKQKEIIDQSKEPISNTAVKVPIKLYGADWELKVSSLNPPISFYKLVLEVVFVLVWASLMMWLTYLILTMLEQKEQLKKIAMYDPLTNLANRRLLNIKLDNFIKNNNNEKHKVVVCYLDLDGFKAVNDAYGHEVGDQLLKVVAQKLSGVIKANDFISRIGGDEFVIILNEVESIEQAENILRRIVHVVSEQITISDLSIHISVSLGAAVYKVHGEEPEHLLRVADQAMYQAKAKGKNRYYFAEKIA